MNIDLGMVRFSLPDDEPMAPVMFIAMGEKEEAEKLSVGPTLAKATTQQFRRTLTLNMSTRAANEEIASALDRTAKDLIARVRGKTAGTSEKNVNDIQGQFVEFTHEGQQKTPLRSLCWVGCKEMWIVTLNLTGLDKKNASKSMTKMMDGVIATVGL